MFDIRLNPIESQLFVSGVKIQYIVVLARTLTCDIPTLLNACIYIHSCALDGYVNNCIPYLDDGFEDFVDLGLRWLMKCFSIALRENNSAKVSAETLAIYRRIGEIFVSLRMKHYGSIFPDMEEAYCFLMTVNTLSGTDEEDVLRSRQLPVFVNCKGLTEQCQSRPCADSIGDRSRRYKDAGNAFFSLGDYLRSLEFYNKRVRKSSFLSGNHSVNL